MLSIGGERVVILVLHFPVMQFQLITVVTSETLKANFAAVLLRPQLMNRCANSGSNRFGRYVSAHAWKKARFRVDFFFYKIDIISISFCSWSSPVVILTLNGSKDVLSRPQVPSGGSRKYRKLHRESEKTRHQQLLITSPNVDRFSIFFTVRLISKFATNSCLNIPPRCSHVATLSCEISVFKIATLGRKCSEMPCKK